MLHFLHWCCTRTALLSANQNRVIFSCILLGLKSYASMISDQTLHSTQFNYHFIQSILKSHNFMSLNFRFWCIVPSRAGLLERAEPETLLFSMHICHVTKTHWSITNKQAVLTGSENEKSLFHASKFDSLRLNQWWESFGSFLVWLRLRLFVLFGERIWGYSRCNSAMDFFLVVKLLRLTMPSCG